MIFNMLGVTIIPENSEPGLLTNTACKISTNAIQSFLSTKEQSWYSERQNPCELGQQDFNP